MHGRHFTIRLSTTVGAEVCLYDQRFQRTYASFNTLLYRATNTTMRYFFIVLLSSAALVSMCDGERRGVAFQPEEKVTVATDFKKDSISARKVLVTYTDDVVDKIHRFLDKSVDDDAERRVIDPTKTSVVAPRNIITDVTSDVPHNTAQIPERILIAMEKVQNADDFLRLFVSKEPSDVIYDMDTTMSGFSHTRRPGSLNRKGLSGGGQTSNQITAFARCQPQKKVVKVENPVGEGGVLLWPPCVNLFRCGGCCVSELMTCNPTAISYVNVTVLQARYNGPQSNLFTNEGIRHVPMEQHDSCACDCKQLPKDCSPLQEYRKNECRCVCPRQSDADRCQQQSDKFWDSRDCVCKCRYTTECSSGLYFSIKTCRCESARFSLVSRLAKLPRNTEEEEAAVKSEHQSVSAGVNRSQLKDMQYGATIP